MELRLRKSLLSLWDLTWHFGLPSQLDVKSPAKSIYWANCLLCFEAQQILAKPEGRYTYWESVSSPRELSICTFRQVRKALSSKPVSHSNIYMSINWIVSWQETDFAWPNGSVQRNRLWCILLLSSTNRASSLLSSSCQAILFILYICFDCCMYNVWYCTL